MTLARAFMRKVYGAIEMYAKDEAEAELRFSDAVFDEIDDRQVGV